MVSALSAESARVSPDDDALGGLVRRAISGNEDAWRGLIDLYGRRVYAMARSRVRDDELAEEITQSVFATIAAKLTDESYAERGRFEPWLFRITMNRVRDEFRRKKRHAAPTDPTILHETMGAQDPEPAQADAPAQLEGLRGALLELNEQDREIIELRHHGQMTFKQISAVLDEPVGTLLARHHRALKKLRTILEREPAQARDDGANP